MAAVVGDTLRRQGVRSVLTGGACASIHSRGVFQSFDVDLVLGADVRPDALDAAMGSIGFRRSGDHYEHPQARFFVEFLRGPLAVGGAATVRPILLTIDRFRLLALSATDSCRGRLAAFYHWNDRQRLDAAVAIATRQRVQLSRLRQWSVQEGKAVPLASYLRSYRPRYTSRRCPIRTTSTTSTRSRTW